MLSIQRRIFPSPCRLHLLHLRRSFTSKSTSAAAGGGVAALRKLLDSRIVGHSDTKECLLLGLAAREHVFIQGEPGTAKTYAAELTAEATGLQSYSIQFHRDTRLQDLIGDSIILREPSAAGGGSEVVRQSIERGGLLKADVAVLDDITRAPGEALNVLLKILNERMFDGEPLPLRSAIATANSPRDDMYVEPLDPANLDRFALQVKSEGLIFGNNWEAVGDVIDMYASQDSSRLLSAYDVEAKSVAAIDIDSVHLSADIRDCLCSFLQWISDHESVTPRNSLLTDRTFLVKAPRILKAKAALDNRTNVEVRDMAALKHMTTFRVPPAVHEEIGEMLDLLVKTSLEDLPDNDDDDDDENNGGRKNHHHDFVSNVLQQFQQRENIAGSGSKSRNSSSNKSKENTMKMQEDDIGFEGLDGPNKKDDKRNKTSEDEKDKEDDIAKALAGSSALHLSVNSFLESPPLKEGVIRPLRRFWGSSQGPAIKLNLEKSAVSGAEQIMSVIHGRMRRSKNPGDVSSAIPGSVGPPRKRGRMHSIGDPNLLFDADAADMSSWLSSPTLLPRGLLRHPRQRGGTVAFARDISDSMWGPRAALASAATKAAINLARKHKMKFGYCEFSGKAKLYKQYSHGHVRMIENDSSSSELLTDALISPSANINKPLSINDGLSWLSNNVGSLFGFNFGAKDATMASPVGGHFFGMDYDLCETRSRRLDTDGFTNLQEMLVQVLEHFQIAGLPPHERHLVIVTDGSPTEGSPTCRDEALLASTLGVAIHPIFVSGKLPPQNGKDGNESMEEYPDVLKFLADETNGVRFVARHDVSFDEKFEMEHDEYAHLVKVRLELAE